jgi:hypothetical protein
MVHIIMAGFKSGGPDYCIAWRICFAEFVVYFAKFQIKDDLTECVVLGMLARPCKLHYVIDTHMTNC